MIDPQLKPRTFLIPIARAARRVAGCVATGLLAVHAVAAEPAPAPLTRVADVLSLSRPQAALSRPVRLRGVVTWRARGGGADFVLQDDSGGIYIDVNTAVSEHHVQQDYVALLGKLVEGTEIELEGRSIPGGHAPAVQPVALSLLGTKPMPLAMPLDRVRFLQGVESCRRIEVHAVVQGFQHTNKSWTLLLNTNPGSFTAEIDNSMCADPAALVDAEIRFRGYASARFNSRGECIAPVLRTNLPEDLVVEKPAPPLEAVPRVALEYLQPFQTEPPGPHRVRVEGSVIFSQPGQFLYMQDGVHAVRIETTSPDPLQPGDRIEVAGFVDMSREIGMLRDATVRRIGSGSPPVAVAINPEEILAINRHCNDVGRMAQPHDFDGHLIRFRARLLAVQTDVGARLPMRRLLLERQATQADGSSGLVLQANLQGNANEELDAIQPGSEVEVTGLAHLGFGPHKENRFRRLPTQLDLILRSARDVVVVQAPSWWTARRLVVLLGMVVAVLAAAICWSLMLKRQVRRKTRLLAREMSARRDSAVEFQATLRERNLIAANLHDTLLQTLGGLGFQLDACKAEAQAPAVRDQPPVHLDFARRMLNHAVDELRNSVWTLRSLPLDGMSLPDALELIASRVGAGRETRIEVLADPLLCDVPDFIAGNLLLVAQEALHNALKHAAPRTVTLEVQALDDPPRVCLTVCDDGTGFIPGTQLNASDGHFGLSGMRERVDRLAGIFRIQSAPGQGTTIYAEVLLHDYDEEMAERPIDSASPEV